MHYLFDLKDKKCMQYVLFLKVCLILHSLNWEYLHRLVQTMDYSVIVFDTAPTGHTLRLLQFPSTLEKGLAKMMALRNRFGGLISQVILYVLLSAIM